MPYYKRKKPTMRKPRKKTYRRRRRPIVSSNPVGSRLVSTRNYPLGQAFKTTLPYFENGIEINPGLAGTAWYNFSANGLYDPNVTGTGHQPLGFDQLMLMYDHYTVIGAKITVTVVNTDATYPQIIGIKVADEVQSETNVSRVIENGNVNYTTIGAYKSDQAVVTLSRKLSIKKFFRKPINDSEFQGSASANPTEQVFFSIFCSNTTDSFDSAAVRFHVKIDYIAVFREPKLLTQS